MAISSELFSERRYVKNRRSSDRTRAVNRFMFRTRRWFAVFANRPPLVNETPGVCGGYPCVGDTRIPVRLLVEAFRKTPDERMVAEAYPQLTPEQIRGAFAYYLQNPVRVDEDIERNRRTLATLATLSTR